MITAEHRERTQGECYVAQNETTSFRPVVSQYSSSLDDDPSAESQPLLRSSALSPVAAKSPGVARIEIINSQLTPRDRIWMFVGVFLVGYAYGLDSQVRSTYQSYATSSFGEHSLLATVNVIRSVIAAAAQPAAARVADVFGRFELVAISMIFYLAGTVIESCSTTIEVFSVGTVLYQLGYTGIVLLVEIIIADITSMRSRVLFSYLPATPFIINTWISGSITSAVLHETSWRWGIGMWGIIYAVCSLPLLIILFSTSRRAQASGALKHLPSPLRYLGLRRLGLDLFHQLDMVGIVLMIAIFGFILAPLTIAGGIQSQWRSAHIITPLAIGVLCIPAFVLWEMKGARHPLAPFDLLKDRGVWSALLIRCLLNFSWYLQADYLYTVLIVAFDFSVATATRVQSFYSFFGLISGLITGLVIYKVRRLKYFIVAGTCIFLVAYGLVIHFRGGASGSSQAGVIGAQILLGLAGGFFAYPTQASVQAATKHEHMAVLTGIYLGSFNIGSALGTCVSGAIWTQTLYKSLVENLAFQSNSTLARAVYDSPFEAIPSYPIGTLERNAIVYSYRHVQRLLCITGICLAAPMIALAFVLRNPRLSTEQSQPEVDTYPGDDEQYPGTRRECTQ
ncbi:uncharacterized protein N7459_006391 [Penicillium hispanicum]|uniref:uncharacterized protein n=1 Tax=Penicillium hispanicum TaxID=1080232 RepID=UPI0025413D62|nr:uncharacterized protein N7459_006391 [Penicillium hispanicum]KAJ5577427.1 hypothetical protein N7459_006391 [Penicillium hispanicum]